jgi:DNA-binding response OmpR family regulator
VLHLSTSDFMVGRDNPPSVLVIDDDPDMRQVLSDFLQRGGYRVVEAANGQEGIFAAQSEPIDAVILDKEMPGMNGLDVLSFFQHRCPGLPIIFITAFGGRDDEDESRRRGAWLYLEKPFRVATVVEAVQSVLERAAP